MDFKDIKPPGIEGARPDRLDQTSLNPRPETSSTQPFALEQSARPTTAPGLAAIAHLDPTVLQDPGKLESAVRASIAELIDSKQDLTGPLSNSEKKFFTDFLVSDPLVRRQVEGLLRKALT
jgi:hypothetical protein